MSQVRMCWGCASILDFAPYPDRENCVDTPWSDLHICLTIVLSLQTALELFMKGIYRKAIFGGTPKIVVLPGSRRASSSSSSSSSTSPLLIDEQSWRGDRIVGIVVESQFNLQSAHTTHVGIMEEPCSLVTQKVLPGRPT